MVKGKLVKKYRRNYKYIKKIILVEERKFDYDLTYFDIYVNGVYNGSVFPDDFESMYGFRQDLIEDVGNCLLWDGITKCEWDA